MNKLVIGLAAGAALLLSAALLQAAESWNLVNEEEASFEATVVDMICILTGDCPEECGAGDRQLGLINDQGRLVPVGKNLTFFAGASLDLKAFCNQPVEVDGFYVSLEGGPRFYFLQFIRALGEEEWIRANDFARQWAEREGFDPAGNERKKWWNNDPRVLEVLEQDGVLGLGQEADENYFDAN